MLKTKTVTYKDSLKPDKRFIRPLTICCDNDSLKALLAAELSNFFGVTECEKKSAQVDERQFMRITV
jgi:hypothetical protein